MFSGCATALVTPMKADGSVDEDGLRSLVRWQEEAGIRAIVPVGTTGESATLSLEEHLGVIKVVREEASKSKVIAGAGANSTGEAIHLSKEAQDLGVDGLLSVSPYYVKPTPAGVIAHYKAIAASVDVPIIVYNIPSRTGSNITPATMMELASIPGIAGVKEASGDIVQLSHMVARAPAGFCVLSGDDAMALPAMAVGASGVISVASNIVPERMVALVKAVEARDFAKAKSLNAELLPLFSSLFVETNPIPVKTALGLMGRPAGPLRLPLCPLTETSLSTLRAALESYRLI